MHLFYSIGVLAIKYTLIGLLSNCVVAYVSIISQIRVGINGQFRRPAQARSVKAKRASRGGVLALLAGAAQHMPGA